MQTYSPPQTYWLSSLDPRSSPWVTFRPLLSIFPHSLCSLSISPCFSVCDHTEPYFPLSDPDPRSPSGDGQRISWAQSLGKDAESTVPTRCLEPCFSLRTQRVCGSPRSFPPASHLLSLFVQHCYFQVRLNQLDEEEEESSN